MPPRPSLVALATFIAISFILILHQFSSSSSYYRDAFTRSRSLKTWLKDEEEHYTAFLQDRQQLIRKWGPTESAVQPWVPPAMLFTFLTRPCAHVHTSDFAAFPLHPKQFPFKGIPRIQNCTLYVRTRALMSTNHVLLTHFARGLFYPCLPMPASR
jgi:hypothetical protein